MDDIRQTAIARFRAYLERRQFSARRCSRAVDFHVRGIAQIHRD